MSPPVLHVRGQDSHFQIYGQNVREFPPVPDFEGEPDFKVNVESLAGAIDRTMFAAARESTRYAINGVLWERKGKKLQLVATDGRRLASTVISVEKGSAADGSAIVPLKTLTLLARLKHAADDMIDVRGDDVSVWCLGRDRPQPAFHLSKGQAVELEVKEVDSVSTHRGRTERRAQSRTGSKCRARRTNGRHNICRARCDASRARSYGLRRADRRPPPR